MTDTSTHDLHELHEEVGLTLSSRDLDRLMRAARLGDGDGIAAVVEAYHGSADTDGLPSRDAFAAYAAALSDRYRRTEGAVSTPEAVLEDLDAQPCAAEAADFLRRDLPDAALAILLVHERYPGTAAEGALRLLAPKVRGQDMAFLPLARPFRAALDGLPDGSLVAGRFGNLTELGRVRRGGRNGPAFDGPRGPEDVEYLRQLWRVVPAGDPAVAEAIRSRLASLAEPDGRLRPGLCVDAVVSALLSPETDR